MLSTARPSRRPCHAPRLAIPILLALGAGALVAPTATAQAPASTAISGPAAMTAGALTSGSPARGAAARVVDGANILDDAAAASAVEKAAKDGITLSILTATDETSKAEALAKKEWRAKGMGASNALLVINMPASGSNSYYLATGSDIPASKRSELGSEIGSYMRSRDFDGAVAALPGLLAKAKGGSGTEGSSGGSATGLVLLAGGGAAAAGAAAYAVSRRRRLGASSPQEDNVFWNRKKRAPEPVGPVPLDQLIAQAGAALVTADDAMRAADEELSYAQAQFGLSATDSFTEALGQAKAHLSRCFELRKILDDDIPETEAQQRQMYGEILDRCQQAMGAIRAQNQLFEERRGIESALPTSMSETAQRADETEQAITMAKTLLVTLHATYPASALTSVSEAPARAERLLAAGRTALEQARASADAGQQSTAVEQVRIAQGSIAQAGTLAAQVTSANARLSTASADLAAAIASLSSDLVDAKRLADQVPSATLSPLVADAEAAIAEGRAASGRASTDPSAPATGDQVVGDPLAALDHLSRAETAIDAALAPARAKEENDSRARSQLGSRLSRLNSQVQSVTTYITTHRGAVGSSARTALSEAARHASAATIAQSTDPQAALAEVAAGEPLVAQAQALAEADVRDAGNAWGAGSSHSGGYGRRGGGLDLGSLVLGGILMGGLFDDDRPHHIGGWGGGDFGGFGGDFGDFGGSGGDF
ncbi:TPM domain-containing protein [Actinomyces marmotae]|uniref:TPM domain-containing protein n=1 Tax=Actinomyces marmotae TaxID=2737173 RepID=UPI001F17DF6A|nr:TPM domain-containing protein [Actinomyces marmotae]